MTTQSSAAISSRRARIVLRLVILLGTTMGCGAQIPDAVTDPGFEDLFSLGVSPSSASIVEGEAIALAATVTDGAGRVIAGRSISWSSTQPEVVAVTSDGRTTGRSPGVAFAVATSEDLADSVEITVLQRVTEILMQPASISLTPGETQRLSVLLIDARGDEVSGRDVRWFSEDSSVANVSLDGTVEAWDVGVARVGAGIDGASGFAAVQVDPPLFASVTAGNGHTCGLTTLGVAYCWGAGDHGQLGSAGAEGKSPSVRVPLHTALVQISAGTGYTCATAVDGAAYCWGDNSMMELGSPDVGKASPTPVRVTTDLPLTNVSTSDMSHTCAMGLDDVAYCWGYNRFGQVGNGSTRDEPFPLPVVGRLSFGQLAAGYFRTCGLDLEGTPYCWGRGGHAQLGNTEAVLQTCTSRPCYTSPVRVQTSLTFTTISTGSAHTCALTAGGEAYCWGANESGQLGMGPADSSVAPAPVAGGLLFSQISAAESHTCGITQQSEAYCWGANGDGRLGSGTTDPSDVPVPVDGGLAFMSVSTGMTHTCGVSNDGGVYCWGDNAMGQLGDGSVQSSLVPVRAKF